MSAIAKYRRLLHVSEQGIIHPQVRTSSKNAQNHKSIYLQRRKMPPLFPFQALSPLRSNPEAFDLKLRVARECIEKLELPVVFTRASLCSPPPTASLASELARFYRVAISVLRVAHQTMRGK
jgi:hypothetical protein